MHVGGRFKQDVCIRRGGEVSDGPEWKPYSASVDLDARTELPCLGLIAYPERGSPIVSPPPLEIPPSLASRRVSLDAEWIKFLTSLYMKSFPVIYWMDSLISYMYPPPFDNNVVAKHGNSIFLQAGGSSILDKSEICERMLLDTLLNCDDTAK